MKPDGNIRDTLREGRKFLASEHVENPALEAEILLAFTLGCERIRLYTDSDRPVSAAEGQVFMERLAERKAGRPTAYIVGYREFYEHRFAVTPATLIPRPETEEMVNKFLNQESLAEGARLLDLCCGSGCIGVSVLAERSDCRMDFADISPEALEVARRNAREILPSLQDRIRFFEGDLFENTPPGKYRAILCNPPYVHPDEIAGLDTTVRDYEPHTALFHPDPPAFYERILEEARGCLSSDGVVYLELSPRFAGAALQSARRFYRQTELFKDYGDRERILVARV